MKNRKILHVGIIGCSGLIHLQMAKALASQNIVFYQIPEAPPVNTSADELREVLSEMATAGKKAADASLEFKLEVERREYFIPEKIHPKHQKNNKYRFKK